MSAENTQPNRTVKQHRQTLTESELPTGNTLTSVIVDPQGFALFIGHVGGLCQVLVGLREFHRRKGRQPFIHALLLLSETFRNDKHRTLAP